MFTNIFFSDKSANCCSAGCCSSFGSATISETAASLTAYSSEVGEIRMIRLAGVCHGVQLNLHILFLIDGGRFVDNPFLFVKLVFAENAVHLFRVLRTGKIKAFRHVTFSVEKQYHQPCRQGNRRRNQANQRNNERLVVFLLRQFRLCAAVRTKSGGVLQLTAALRTFFYSYLPFLAW